MSRATRSLPGLELTGDDFTLEDSEEDDFDGDEESYDEEYDKEDDY